MEYGEACHPLKRWDSSPAVHDVRAARYGRAASALPNLRTSQVESRSRGCSFEGGSSRSPAELSRHNPQVLTPACHEKRLAFPD
ncbi:hypothetical protein VTI74DRAFT_4697 [Chaetomium olivicolor]